MNSRAWSIWCLLETQWNVAPMGGLLGWGGYGVAKDLLVQGHGARGEELLAEIERLHLLELAQLEIETAKRKKAKNKKKDGKLNEDDDRDEGDIDDFMEDAIMPDDDE